MISASDNITDIQNSADTIQIPESEDIDVNLQSSIDESQLSEISDVQNTSIVSNNPKVYYGENTQLVSYLKDDNSQPLANKKLTIFLNGQTYTRITDNAGKIVLNLNLKPNTYHANIKFDGDSNYSASYYNAVIKVLKAPVSLTVNSYSTYYNSDLFFKTKVINKITKSL